MKQEASEPLILVDSITFDHLQSGRRNRVAARAMLAAVAVSAIAALIAWPRPERAQAVVRRGDIVQSWVALGRVESGSVVEIIPRIVGRIASILVKEGDAVEAGQLLVLLETASLQAEVDEAERVRDAAEAGWEEIERGARSEDLDQAAGHLVEREQEAKAAEGRVRVAAAEAECSDLQWRRLAHLGDEGLVPRRDVDEARRRREAAAAALAEAKASHQAIEARQGQARAALERLRRGAMPEERRRVKAELRRAESRVVRLKEELAQARIVAPMRGIVVRRYKEPSELAFPQMAAPILVLAGVDDRYVLAEVLETELFKVRSGQEATLTSDAYPGRRWQGRIAEISPSLGKKRFLSENPKERTDVKVLEVKIRTSEPLGLPLNLPMEARIEEVLRRNVLVVPDRALDSSGCVYRLTGERRRISPGARDDSFIEVLSGLDEGDRLLFP